MGNTKRKKTGRRLGWLLLMAALLSGVLFFRAAQSNRPAAVTTPLPEAATPTVASTPSPTAQSDNTPAPERSSPAAETPSVAGPTPRPVPWRSMSYTDQSYFLVTDMVYAYRHDQSAAMETVRSRLAELKALDEDLGAVWENIMEYWDYVNTAQEIQYGLLPEGLPEDDSLCLVVLGFQLLPDGDMEPELIGRCEVALACAQQYPNALILVTGGGTAYRKPDVTEAGQMAAWLIGHGVDESRIFVEDRSRTTAENASFSDVILYDRCPQVHSIAIITSDYHVGMGSLMFNTVAQRRAYETGELPYAVVANAAFPAEDREGTETAAKQATFLWSLLDPKV